MSAHRAIISVILAIAALLTCCVPQAVAGAPDAPPITSDTTHLRGVRPVPGAMTRGFDPPDVNWHAGHRGVDLEAPVGSQVRSPIGGVLTFAGSVAGRPVVVITHGTTRETFEPVSATVPVGSVLQPGDVFGRVEASTTESGIHWGLLRGETYLDPLSLLGGRIRLLSDAEASARGAPR